jgi:hypothetical protein
VVSHHHPVFVSCRVLVTCLRQHGLFTEGPRSKCLARGSLAGDRRCVHVQLSSCGRPWQSSPLLPEFAVGFRLCSEIVPVVDGDRLLSDLSHDGYEVAQGSDCLVRSAVEPRHIFPAGPNEDGVLDGFQRNGVGLHSPCGFVVRGSELPRCTRRQGKPGEPSRRTSSPHSRMNPTLASGRASRFP